jgi:RNA polymerase sigma-70 factor, ECF subfamily
MDDVELVKRVLAGDGHEFGRLVDKYQASVFRVCMGFLHHRHDAEDVAQEVFVNAYRSLSGFQGQASFRTWLYRIAVNQSLTHLRSKKRRSIIGFVEAVGESMGISKGIDNQTPHQLLEANELRLQLEHALSKLPENQRIAFVLSKYEQLPQADIAKTMLLSEGAVESLLQRAKKGLQKSLSNVKK